ncbi:MAG: MmgE/PrpD family protein [Spirochaetes bacterium]|nr:MmgE/PrpD family protein [Spirochaetota bacterium]
MKPRTTGCSDLDTNKSDVFSDYLFEFINSELSCKVVERAALSLLDYLGVAIAGSFELRDKTDKIIDGFGCKNGKVNIIGQNRKTELLNAVFVNALNGHVLELDDGSRFGMMHPGVPVITAVLNAVQHFHKNRTDLIKGIVSGYQAAIMLATAAQPSHKERGFHATATCGAIGAAVGVASVLNLDRNQLKNAIAAAVTGAGGSLKVIESGSQLKPLNAARAALTGLSSALTAKAGFYGPDDVFGGDNGFFKAMTNVQSENAFVNIDKNDYLIMHSYMKPYAACRHCHSPIEAVLNIVNREKIDFEQIKSIHVDTYKWAVKGHDHSQIRDISSAKMSIPYSVAAAAVFKSGGMDSFTEKTVKNDKVLRLTKLVSVSENDKLTMQVPGKRAAIVTLNVNDYIFNETVELPKGEPENPLTREDVIEKFNSLLQFSGKTQKYADRLCGAVFDRNLSLRKMFKLI